MKLGGMKKVTFEIRKKLHVEKRLQKTFHITKIARELSRGRIFAKFSVYGMYEIRRERVTFEIRKRLHSKLNSRQNIKE